MPSAVDSLILSFFSFFFFRCSGTSVERMCRLSADRYTRPAKSLVDMSWKQHVGSARCLVDSLR